MYRYGISAANLNISRKYLLVISLYISADITFSSGKKMITRFKAKDLGLSK